jgi:uncharacterized protein
MTATHDIVQLIQLNGGQLVGKTRLQKSAYFLESMNLGFGFDFSYYRFGPYSEDLANSADDAIALRLLDIDWKEAQGGASYAVFRSRLSERPIEQNQYDAQRKQVLDILKKFSSVELELAATADFLKRNGFASDPWAETKRRKANKVDAFRLEKSQQLLQELKSL